MFTSTARVIHAGSLPDDELEPEELPADRVLAGEPTLRAYDVTDGPVAIGVWQHSVGVSTDVEVDEAFVVLQGRATIEVEGGPTLQVGPGDLGLLPAGARTTWTVHEKLRKVYVIPS